MNAKKYVIIVNTSEGTRFWVSGRKWSDEFPDAGVFHSLRDARATAKQFGPQAFVADYELAANGHWTQPA